MNLFSDTLLRSTVQYMSNPIVLNPDTDDEYTVNGFITNATLSPNSSYHLHSDSLFMRGDCMMMDSDYYLVTGDVIQERGSKYKGIIDFCNYKNVVKESVSTGEIVGYYSNGRPIWKTETVIVGLFVGTIRHREVMISASGGITVAHTETILTIKDTAKAREFYTVNAEFTFQDVNWMVREVNNIRQGLLELKLMSVL